MIVGQYERVSTVNIYPIIHQLHNDRFKQKYGIICGHIVKLQSQRYTVFKKNLSCVSCGIRGSFFAVEKIRYEKTNRYHLNLYGIDSEGNEVLMTKDHIIPLSKDGKNRIQNYQTMCTICNTKKGNKL